MATKVKEPTPTEIGKQQSEQISGIYRTFDDKQREAFLLGRISGLLDLGNSVTDGANEAIAQAEAVLQEIRQRMHKKEEKPKKETKKAEPVKRQPAAKKKSNVIINKRGAK